MLNLGSIPGDGTGPEVVTQAIKVLAAVSEKFQFKYELEEFDIGGERYLKTGEVLPDSVYEGIKSKDAVILGAVGHVDVKPGILEQGILLKLRFELDQYINLRPVKLFPNVDSPLKDKTSAEINYTIVRENVGGLYTGIGGISAKGTPNEVAVQSMVYTRFQVERCLRWAFDYTRKFGKKTRGLGDKNTLALIGKTNVLTHVFDLWERAFNEIGKADYADINREYYHVDATCLYQVWMPEKFDVLVTSNMFGDIITDLAAITQGGLGIAAGGNINPEGVSMFEPIGGTAPDHTGKNTINPLAAILAMGMLLEQTGQSGAVQAIENAVSLVTPKMKSQAAGEMGYSTTEIGDLVVGNL